MNNDFYCELIKLALDLKASTCRIVLTGAILSQGALYVIFRVFPPVFWDWGPGPGALELGKFATKQEIWEISHFSLEN